MSSMPLRFCTVTGVDSSTDLPRIAELGKRFPFSEWGVLYAPKLAGLHPRFPAYDQVLAVGRHLSRLGIPAALHLCGTGARRLIDGEPDIETLVKPFGRIQLNLIARKYSPQELEGVAQRVRLSRPTQRLILQANSASASLCQALAGTVPFEFLFDSSGGRGRSPEQWPSLALDQAHGLSQSACGFSGGLGPDNLTQELARIQAACHGNPIWIDMEGKLRNNQDVFDLDVVESALSLVDAYLRDCA